MLTPWRRRTEMFCSTRLANIPAERQRPLSRLAGYPAATCSIGHRLRPRAEDLMGLPETHRLFNPQQRPGGGGT